LGFANLSRDIFPNFLNYIRSASDRNFPISEQKSIVILKNNIGGGDRASVTK
jgi:hypothetical protein